MVLHSKIFGNNSHHLLIFHGLFGMSSNWLSIAKILCINFTVHIIDLRNHGESFHHNSMTLFDLAYDIFNYVNYHNLVKFSLLGHSLGGKAVMEYVLRYPSINLYKVIIVDIVPKKYPSYHDNILKVLNMVNLDILQTRKEIENYLKKFIFDQKIIFFLLKNLYWSNKKLKFRFNLDAIIKNYNYLIDELTIKGLFFKPILFLYGENTNYFCKEDKNIIYTQFKNVEFYMIKNANHWIHIDNPSQFIKKVTVFLDC